MVISELIEKLEDLVWEAKNCEIIFSDDAGKVIITGRIEGIYEREDFTVLKMQSGQEIRLDKLIRVGGIDVKNFC
jgi:Zn-finger protein